MLRSINPWGKGSLTPSFTQIMRALNSRAGACSTQTSSLSSFPWIFSTRCAANSAPPAGHVDVLASIVAGSKWNLSTEPTPLQFFCKCRFRTMIRTLCFIKQVEFASIIAALARPKPRHFCKTYQHAVTCLLCIPLTCSVCAVTALCSSSRWPEVQEPLSLTPHPLESGRVALTCSCTCLRMDSSGWGTMKTTWRKRGVDPRSASMGSPTLR